MAYRSPAVEYNNRSRYAYYQNYDDDYQARDLYEQTVRAIRDAPNPLAEYDMLSVKRVNDWNEDAMKRPDPKPLWLSLWYEKEVCCLFADSNLGKSIYAVQIANQIAHDGNVVIYFDFELSDKAFQLRYTSKESGLYTFSSDFYRAEINPNNIPEGNFEENIINEIEKVVNYYQAPVIIIDNLTWLCMASEKGDAASQLMLRLRQLRDKYDLSILIVAHTPKRSLSSPITQNDLAGSKKLFNFFSSVFAIGKSAKDPNLRYIKQVKTRAGAFEYGAEHVIVAEIAKWDNNTFFHTLGHGTEKEHLLDPQGQEKENQIAQIRNLRDEGLTIREIADKLKLSKTTVGRYL